MEKANAKPTEKTIVDLETKYWQAIKDNDGESALALNDDPVVVTGAHGVGSIDRKTFAAMMKQSNWSLEDFKLDKIEVRVLSDECAIIAYNIHEKMIVDGKPLELDAADTSTWVKRNGEWKCAMHTEALKGDPFGRDRKPASAATQTQKQ